MVARTSVLDSLVSRRCWYVSSGGATAPSFTLICGDKVPRPKPLANPMHPQEFREFRGSHELLVWCSWRLEQRDAVLASSAQERLGTAELNRMCDATVESVDCTPPAWDLRIAFSNGLRLVVFCDNVEPGSPIGENWELWTPEVNVAVGPGACWKEEVGI